LKLLGELRVGNISATVEVMLDSGAMGMCYMDREFAKKLGLKLKKIGRVIKVRSIDGTACGSGEIKECVCGQLQLLDLNMDLELLIIDSPAHQVILGYQWFKKYNPTVDWQKEQITFRNCMQKNEAGIPACTSEGIPNRQVLLNSKQDVVTGQRNLSEEVLDVNALINLIEEDEDLLIGFVESYSMVENDSDVSTIPGDILSDYSDVFSSSEFPLLPPHRDGIDLEIELDEGKTPPFGPIYSLSVEEGIVLKKYIEGALAAGIIRESKSPAGSPVMFVKKSDGTLRLCVDYRGLNSVSRTNRAALPIIRDMLFRAHGARYYSKIDLKNAFNLVRIVKGQEYLTAFRTKYGHFEYLVMPFGLKNAPGHFQAFMNSVFCDLIDRGLLVYIDDLLLYSLTKEDHQKLLLDVFNRLRANNLKANPKKCVFYQSRVNFLGHTISVNGVEMDSSKVKSIQSWKSPENVKEIQSFLGLCNYYRDFIPRFAHIAGPLYKLTKKSNLFVWDSDCEKSFNSLKAAFATECVLIQPDQTKQFYLESDASDYALGGVLSQKDENDRLRPIGFFSRKFTAAEINYEIYDKELLSIIECLRNFRHYCIGTKLPVIVYTDHKNLQYFMTSRHLNRRQARWSLFLADYNISITVRPGNQQVVSDALSRQEALKFRPEDEEYLVNEQILLTQDKFNFKERSSDFSSTKLKDRAIINALDTSDEEAEMSASNSDYDAANYQSDISEGSSFDEDDIDAVGDVSQFEEFQGGTQDSPDPLLFQYLLQYLWNGELPYVLVSSILNKIKRLAKSYIFKNDRLYKMIIRRGQTYHVPYVPFVERGIIGYWVICKSIHCCRSWKFVIIGLLLN
jgi:hypothetical protein